MDNSDPILNQRNQIVRSGEDDEDAVAGRCELDAFVQDVAVIMSVPGTVFREDFGAALRRLRTCYLICFIQDIIGQKRSGIVFLWVSSGTGSKHEVHATTAKIIGERGQ